MGKASGLKGCYGWAIRARVSLALEMGRVLGEWGLWAGVGRVGGLGRVLWAGGSMGRVLWAAWGDGQGAVGSGGTGRVLWAVGGVY